MQLFPEINGAKKELLISEIGILVFIISIDMGKEFYLEYKRHRADILVNESKCTIIKGLGPQDDLLTEETQIQNINVGDILKISDNEQVPADCIVLKSAKANC